MLAVNFALSLLDLLFCPKDIGNEFLRNVGKPLLDSYVISLKRIFIIATAVRTSDVNKMF
jgi:hypothetical protein